MSEHYKIIHDEEEIRKFYEGVLPELKPLEVYFVSMSARNKYLTVEERAMLDLGRTEMYAKTIIRQNSFDEYLKHIKRLECNIGGYTSRNNTPIPEKCMVCYANICPSSTITALQKFQKLISEYTTESLSLNLLGNNDASLVKFLNRMNKIDNNLLTFYQNSHTSKKWLDIDIDMINKSPEDTEFIKDIIGVHGFNQDSARLIDTKSGYHLLLSKENLKENPLFIISDLDTVLEAKEIVINKNEMIPLPGTYQAGHKVRFINLYRRSFYE